MGWDLTGSYHIQVDTNDSFYKLFVLVSKSRNLFDLSN